MKDNEGFPVVIGSGAFGKVYRAVDMCGRPVALKVMKKDHIEKNGFQRRVLDEIRIHSTLIHPRIVEVRKDFGFLTGVARRRRNFFCLGVWLFPR